VALGLEESAIQKFSQAVPGRRLFVPQFEFPGGGACSPDTNILSIGDESDLIDDNFVIGINVETKWGTE